MPQEIINILITWFPMLLLIGVWIFFMKKMGSNKDIVNRNMQYLDDINTLTAKQVAALERIATALEKQNKAP